MRARKIMDPISKDAIAIWRDMQFHEKELLHKRRFLMGLSEIDSLDPNMRSHKGKLSMLPESLLRKDDVFYEDVKNFVEKAFRACATEARQNKNDDDEEIYEAHNLARIILTFLDDLSNNGLFRLAKIVTGNSVVIDKTRPQMNRVIKKSLLQIYRNLSDSSYQGQMQNQLSQLLKNPKNFRQNHRKYMKMTRKSFSSALNEAQLQKLPLRILYAMYRKLKGTQGYIPKLCPRPSGWTKQRLIARVMKLSGKMINQIDESDEPHGPLVKAMAIPGLYSKINSDLQDPFTAGFVPLPAEMEALQNEIVKAIWLLGQRFTEEELKNLQLLLDPKSKVDTKDLRLAIRNMLIEYLFECSDMEAVPDSLVDALSLINKKSCSTSMLSLEERIEEEVECILNVGVHMKQILWDCIPIDKLDQDFADAYMEELEESDDGDFFDDDDEKQLHTNFSDEVKIRFNEFSEEIASAGDADRANYSSATSTYKDNFGYLDDIASGTSFRSASFTDKDECRHAEISGREMHFTAAGDGSSPFVSLMLQGIDNMMGSQNSPNNNLVDTRNLFENCSKQNPMSDFRRNRYVALQEVCDRASLVAYQLIGHVLAEFGQMEASGLNWKKESYLRGKYLRSRSFLEPVANSKDKDLSGSIIVHAVHRVIPSFPSSKLETMKKFMSSQ